MREKFICFISLVITLSLFSTPAHAALIDITDPTLPHFGDFSNTNSPGDYSNISKDFIISGNTGLFGWHYNPSNHGSSIAGILLNPKAYAVTSLRFEIHQNPFKDFRLQGSMDTTTGFDGNWDTLLSSTVTERTELATQTWSFDNSNYYSAYRINVLNDYTEGVDKGWAMYRWELLAEDDYKVNAVPEPISSTLFLFGGGAMAARGWLRKRRSLS